MYKCRICLSSFTSKRKLQSIFDSINGNSFASMMMSLSNILKINTVEGITEEICKTCCEKLVQAYDFKVQMERSEEALLNSAGVKRLHFTNLQDKIKIEIDTKKDITKQCSKDINDSFKCGETTIVYNNTTIQKILCDNIAKENKSMSVADFLNTFQADHDIGFHDFDDCNNDDYTPQSDDDDPDYGLPQSARKTKTKKKKHKSKDDSSDNKDLNKILIKPVILRNIRVMPTMVKQRKPKKGKYSKEDMCNYCGKMTKSIRIHLLTHTGVRSHKCDICSKAFLSLSSLYNHKKTHKKDREFKCDKCVATFKTANALQSHSVMHLDEKKFVCETCNKAFKRKKTLQRHKLAHNVANKCIKCNLCNMSFFSNFGLKHHLRIHTGERPFKCELCSQPYSYKHDFNRHCLKKHGVFLKRRIVHVMNEEVLQRERALMRELMIKMQGISKEDEPLNPFSDEGPQAALAFELAMKALKSNNIPIDGLITDQ